MGNQDVPRPGSPGRWAGGTRSGGAQPQGLGLSFRLAQKRAKEGNEICVKVGGGQALLSVGVLGTTRVPAGRWPHPLPMDCLLSHFFSSLHQSLAAAVCCPLSQLWAASRLKGQGQPVPPAPHRAHWPVVETTFPNSGPHKNRVPSSPPYRHPGCGAHAGGLGQLSLLPPTGLGHADKVELKYGPESPGPRRPALKALRGNPRPHL